MKLGVGLILISDSNSLRWAEGDNLQAPIFFSNSQGIWSK